MRKGVQRSRSKGVGVVAKREEEDGEPTSSDDHCETSRENSQLKKGIPSRMR